MQRETSQQLRTIITSAAHNTPPLSGCAEESVTAAGDSSAVSPSASGSHDLALDAGGASSWWVAECVSSGVTRVHSCMGWLSLACAIQVWAIQAAFGTPPGCCAEIGVCSQDVFMARHALDLAGGLSCMQR